MSSSSLWRVEESHDRRIRQRHRRWQASFGIHTGISPLNFAAFMLHSASSIVFLVFLNATQPFVIAQLGESKRQGSLSGTLIFADELFSMLLALLWGSLADILGTKPVAVLGYIFIALSLYAYTVVHSAFPGLLLARLIFAVGGSAVTSMLTGILNSYAATRSDRSEQDQSDEHAAIESSPLLNGPVRRRPKDLHGRLAALAGLTTGCGALFAVFILLRLPTRLARWHDRSVAVIEKQNDEALLRGTQEAFYVVACLAILIAATLALGLKMDAPSADSQALSSPPIAVVSDNQANLTAREARRQRLRARTTSSVGRQRPIFSLSLRQLIGGIFRGFQLAGHNDTLSLAYAGSALARASTIATTVFIPLLVTRFFYSTGQCSGLPNSDVPPEELKKLCRQAFTVASILSGVAQLTALLAAPLFGLLCDAKSAAKALLLSSLIGATAYTVIATALPHDGDPRGPVAIVAAMGMGLGQIGAIVSSLALCAKAKSEVQKPIQHGLTDDQNHTQHSSGAIAGAYSSVGGLSILLISGLGGRLSDTHASAAFVLMSGLATLTAVASAIVVLRTPTSQRETLS